MIERAGSTDRFLAMAMEQQRTWSAAIRTVAQAALANPPTGRPHRP